MQFNMFEYLFSLCFLSFFPSNLTILNQHDFFLVCVTIFCCHTGKMSTFPHHFMFSGVVKNAAWPGGQGVNLCLFLVMYYLLVGGSGYPGIFSSEGFCLHG